MNNKGFTLVEVLAVLVIMAMVVVVVFKEMSPTFSASKEQAYKLMKENILEAGYSYVQECTNGVIVCNFSFADNPVFSANVLKNSGYFDSLESPLDGRNVGECINLEASKDNGVVQIDLIDSCY